MQKLLHRSGRIFVAAVAMLALTLTACEDTGPTQPDDQARGAVEGRMADDQTSGSLSSRTAGFEATGTQTDFSNHTAAVSRIQSDGSLDVVAEASVRADGSFRVEAVPAGESGLVVHITENGNSRGQAMVHGKVPVNGTVVASPVDGETTVEARVLAELHASGQAEGSANPALVALAVEPESSQSVRAMLGSSANLRAAARGVADFASTYSAALQELDVSVKASTRSDARTAAARTFAQARFNGTAEPQAESQLRQDVRARLMDAGVDLQSQVEATSAAGTALARATANASSEVQLAVARGALAINLGAREDRIGELTSTLQVDGDTRSEIEAGLQQASQAIASAETAAEAEAGVEQALASIEAALESSIAARIPGVAPVDVSEILSGLPAEATLESRLEASSSASATAQAFVSFFADLRSQVSSQVSSLVGSGGGVNGEAVAEFFTNLRGVAQVDT